MASNDMEVIDEEFFMLTEHDGSRTWFRKVAGSAEKPIDKTVAAHQSQLTTAKADMSGEDVWATLKMRERTHDSLSPPQQPNAVVDARGWIDIWTCSVMWLRLNASLAGIVTHVLRKERGMERMSVRKWSRIFTRQKPKLSVTQLR